MLRWGRAKYSGICYVRFFPPLGSHSWVKWRRFLSSCTFSHFSGPSIMHLWIKIGGTLEDLLKWACMIFEHTTTRRHFLLHSKKETHLRHLPSMTHTHKCLSLNWTNTDTISAQSTEWHFLPWSPAAQGSLAKRRLLQGQPPWETLGCWPKLRWRSLWRDGWGGNRHC